MLISVVIPAYNRAEYIERTLKSVKEQTYRPIELIIVDNNSSSIGQRANLSSHRTDNC